MKETTEMFDSIEDALRQLKSGGMIIVADDESRENEGDLICVTEYITPESVNFMAKKARGLICVALEDQRGDELDLMPMVKESSDPRGTAFTVSVDAAPKFGVTTGISATDRATTIKQLVNPDAKPADFSRPGHIFPLRAQNGGVLKRAGHTEAAVDLARLAGCQPSGVICEIIKDDGQMARRDDLFAFAKKHNLPFITISDLINYRLTRERFVHRQVETRLPTKFGEFTLIGYHNTLDNVEHVALIKGSEEQLATATPPVRMHSECLTGDILGSLRCDCGDQLSGALEYISEQGSGALIYLRAHEGRGMGLLNKLKAYNLQDEGQDTVEANLSLGFAPDLRDYGVGAQILTDLGISKFKLITNNPKKVIALDGYGLEIVDTVALPSSKNEHNADYLETKQSKMGHNITYLNPDKDEKSA